MKWYHSLKNIVTDFSCVNLEVVELSGRENERRTLKRPGACQGISCSDFTAGTAIFMTDEEKKVIESNMPRFASLEDAMAFIENPDPKLTVPKWIQRGNALIINPEWVNAPYAQGWIWQPSKPL